LLNSHRWHYLNWYYRCQFHQSFTFFVRKFVQSQTLSKEKTFVQKMRAYNVDEIDNRKLKVQWYIPLLPIYKEVSSPCLNPPEYPVEPQLWVKFGTSGGSVCEGSSGLGEWSMVFDFRCFFHLARRFWNQTLMTSQIQQQEDKETNKRSVSLKRKS
jgi:hypothetical protein